MTVNQSPTSGYTLVLSAAAGLLVGLSIIFFWPELASWWPADPRIYTALYNLIGLGQTSSRKRSGCCLRPAADCRFCTGFFAPRVQ